MYRAVCDSASESRWHCAWTQSLWSTKLSVSHQRSPSSYPGEEVVCISSNINVAIGLAVMCCGCER